MLLFSNPVTITFVVTIVQSITQLPIKTQFPSFMVISPPLNWAYCHMFAIDCHIILLWVH